MTHNSESSFTLPRGTCSLCRTPLTSAYIELKDGNKFHTNCFNCHSCQTPLRTQHLCVKKHYYCTQCGESKRQQTAKCAKCNLPSQNENFVLVRGRLLHPTCFTCKNCAVPIAGSYVLSINGEVCTTCNISSPTQPLLSSSPSDSSLPSSGSSCPCILI
jgi:hypothetical protein